MMKQIEQVLDSREVAQMVGKRHDNLVRDIKGYMEELWLLKNEEPNSRLKIQPSDFFREDSYTNRGKVYPCFMITKKGCEFIANKLTGIKGTEFTANYINRFHDMEDVIMEGIPEKQNQPNRIRIMDMNARTRMANMYLKLSQVDTLSPTYKTVLVSKASEVLAGEELIPLPKMEKKSYSAGEIGQIFGISANKVGRIANIHNLKTDQYGEYRRDKSQYSVKEVDTWVYFDSVIPVFARTLIREGKRAGNDIAPMLRRYIATLTYDELCDFEICLSGDDSPVIQDILLDLRKIKADKARTA